MKIALSWLQQFIATTQTPEALAHILTMAGLEVEGMHTYERVRGGLAGVVVGRVLTCAQHPNADKLKVTTVDVGGAQPLHIVCGAPNVAAGQHVLVALAGSTLYPKTGEPITLKPTKIRGEVSEGMICAEDELGLGESHAGIMVLPDAPAPGTPAAQYLHLQSDVVFEIGLTPNRSDAMSHYGVARDLAAVLAGTAQLPALHARWQGTLPPCPVQVSIVDATRCKRFTGLVITGLTVQPSAQWLQDKLLAIGLRPINNVVDATNYVLHELGQPLHAYDLAQVHGGHIIAQTVADGTPFVTLDGVQRSLAATDLMVCDAEGPLCIGGTMGGLASGVSDKTTAIFLEAAYFTPTTVRSSARRMGIHSDSSFRFERGVDPNMAPIALRRAADLIVELAGGQPSAPVDVYPEPMQPAQVTFSYSQATRLMGKDIGRDTMTTILQRLEMGIAPTADADKVQLTVPLYRVDVTRQQDVVEDIIRIYGLNNIAEASKLNASISYQPATSPRRLRDAITDYLTGAGFYEILTNSLVAQQDASTQAVRLLNPLSEELAVLRERLLPSGLACIAYNLNRQATGLRFFEIGTVYSMGKDTNVVEELRLAIYLTGEQAPMHWQAKSAQVDFFTLKGQVQQLLKRLRLQFHSQTIALTDDAELDYGLAVSQAGSTVLRMGGVRRNVCKQYDIDEPVYYAELNLPLVEKLYAQAKIEYAELPKHPAVRRDLSMLVPRGTQYAQIRDLLIATNPKLVQGVHAFDVYDKLEGGQVSYAIGIMLQDPEQTLTDAVVDKYMTRAIEKLEKELQVSVRKG